MRSVIVRYLPATNNRGSRILCIATDSSKPFRKYYTYDHSSNIGKFMRVIAERFIREELSKWPKGVWHEGSTGKDTIFVLTHPAFRTK